MLKGLIYLSVLLCGVACSFFCEVEFVIKLGENNMPYQGIGFAIVLGVGLATAIYYFLSQAGRESAHSNSKNNDKPPSFDHRPHNNSWHEGSRDTSRNTKPKRKSSLYTEGTRCMICLDELSDIKQLPCGHRFHSHCIIKRFIEKRSPSCPLCHASAH